MTKTSDSHFSRESARHATLERLKFWTAYTSGHPARLSALDATHVFKQTLQFEDLVESSDLLSQAASTGSLASAIRVISANGVGKALISLGQLGISLHSDARPLVVLSDGTQSFMMQCLPVKDVRLAAELTAACQQLGSHLHAVIYLREGHADAAHYKALLAQVVGQQNVSLSFDSGVCAYAVSAQGNVVALGAGSLQRVARSFLGAGCSFEQLHLLQSSALRSEGDSVYSTSLLPGWADRPTYSTSLLPGWADRSSLGKTSSSTK